MEILQIALPAIIAGLLIGVTHGFLGLKILQKGIIFIDLAIAQIAGLGLIIGKMFFTDHLWLHQFIAFSFALISAIFFFYIKKIQENIQEAIIGCSFILSASFGMLILSNNPHGSDELVHLLSGQIMFTTFKDVMFHVPIYIITIISWFYFPKIRSNIYFYLIFAIIITSSVQLAGVYIVFTSLIMPALIFRNKKSNKNKFIFIYALSSITMGIVASIILDLPAGLSIVISYFILGLLIYFSTSDNKK